MRAVLWTAYGGPDVLQLGEVTRPTPKDNEVLIGVRATTVTMGDCELRRLDFSALKALWLPMRLYVGLTRPRRIRILGQEVAGVVEAVGKDVTVFSEGDEVFASTGFRLGGNAEYVCLPADGMIALKPANLSFEEAAAVPLGGLEAWQYLKRVNLQPGQEVLINGAGGSIGTHAVQLAKHFGASVTAVDSAWKLDMLRSIGADHVLDYKKQDFAKIGLTYDVIFDAVGTSSFGHSRRALKHDGRYLSANPGTGELIRGLWTFAAHRNEVVAEYTSRRNDDLAFLGELAEAGTIAPVIDKSYPLERTAEAHRYVETGRKKGNLVITVGTDGITQSRA